MCVCVCVCARARPLGERESACKTMRVCVNVHVLRLAAVRKFSVSLCSVSSLPGESDCIDISAALFENGKSWRIYLLLMVIRL